MSDADLSEAVNLFELTSGLNSLDELIPASALSPLPGEARPIPAGNLPAVSTSSDRSAASRSLNGEKAKQSAATGAKHREDLKAIRNREAQKRFKQKQKARASEIEAQLTETQNKMQKLQEQKAQLEARNALLEKVSNLCMKPLNTPLADQAGPAMHSLESAPFKGQEPSVTLSVWGEPCVKTFKELCDMSLSQISAIWSDYIQAMGACLIQLASGNDASVTDELHQLASEAMTLIACRSKTQQPSVSPVMNEDLMAGTQRNGVMHLDPDHYRRILALWSLSEQQACDLMHLRRLSITRRVVLSMQRKVLMAQLATSDGQVLNPTESILTVEELTRALGQNAAEDRKIFYKVARAVHRGVLTLQQTAENFVHAYPHIGSMEVMLEVLADQRGEPSKEQLVEYAQTNPMEAEWKRLIRYHDLLGTGMFPEYLPVSTCHLERREALGVTEY
ncbi:hypothetical protein WJX79_005915 [Trebouxia sp. C0005]